MSHSAQAASALETLLQGRDTAAAERIIAAFDEHKLDTNELVVQGFDLDILCDHIAVDGFHVQTLFNAVFNGYPVSSFNEHEPTAADMLAYMEELAGWTSES